MKIAIYHNLQPGGALNYLINTTKQLHAKHTIDIFSFQKCIPKNIYDNAYIIELKKTNNIFDHIHQILFELREKNYQLANLISKNNYDLIIVHPCILTQAPYILKKLNPNKTIYIFHEPKREFYENTDYQFNNPKHLISRILRYFIKFIDITNCKKAKIIISNSYYSSYILEKIYNKKSFVVQLGLKQIPPQKYLVKNNQQLITSGFLTKIKGHDFTLEQISKTSNNLAIIGKYKEGSETIFKLSKKLGINIKLLKADTYNQVKNILKKYSIYLANPNREPFGIATLEAVENNLFVLGKNEGGTPEIIENGLNGLFYPNDVLIARKTLKSIYNKKYLTIYKSSKIDWNYSASKILNIYHHLTHTPNE